MTTKDSKSNNSPVGVRRDVSTPYDPLDLRTLAESMVQVVLEQKVYPLGDVPSFEGAGVYVIYYTGDYEPYKSIAQKNKGRKWNQPIYVGEAARKGGRKGGVLAVGPAGKVLLSRLKNHVDSIRGLRISKWKTFLSLSGSEGLLYSALRIALSCRMRSQLAIDGFGGPRDV